MTAQGPGISGLSRPELWSLPAYNAGVPEDVVKRRYQLSRVTRLASNENPLGPSPQALAALRNWTEQLHRYPDPACLALRKLLQEHTGVDAGRIAIGNGSEDIIQSLCLAVLSPGDRVLTPAPSFGLHEIFPRMMGAQVEKVRVSTAFTYDLSAWTTALRTPVKMVMFSTPSNPVGCILNREELTALVAAAPEDSLLVVDEAYFEYAQGPDYPDSIAVLAAQARPWMVLRTLSKAYGLAGLRIGYAIASDPDLVGLLDRVRTPFNINGAAQAAAMAALLDPGHLQTVVSVCRKQRASLAHALGDLEARGHFGLRLAPSHGNFLFLDTARSSSAVAEALMQRGVIAKPWRELGFDTFLRVTVGTADDSGHFLSALEPSLAAIATTDAG